MWNLYIMQLKKISRQKSFRITYCLILALAVFNVFSNLRYFAGYDSSKIPHPSTLSMISTESTLISIFIRLFPFILVIPAAYTYLSDFESRSINFIQARSSKGVYCASLILAVLTMTFLCFFVPFLLELALLLIAIPSNGTVLSIVENHYSESWGLWMKNLPFKEILGISRNLYIVFHMFLVSLTAAIFGLVIAALSTFRIRFKVFLLLPIYLFLFFTEQFGNLLSSRISTTYYHYVFAYVPYYSRPKLSFIAFFLVMMLSLLFSIVIFYRRSKQDTLV